MVSSKTIISGAESADNRLKRDENCHSGTHRGYRKSSLPFHTGLCRNAGGPTLAAMKCTYNGWQRIKVIGSQLGDTENGDVSGDLL